MRLPGLLVVSQKGRCDAQVFYSWLLFNLINKMGTHSNYYAMKSTKWPPVERVQQPGLDWRKRWKDSWICPFIQRPWGCLCKGLSFSLPWGPQPHPAPNNLAGKVIHHLCKSDIVKHTHSTIGLKKNTHDRTHAARPQGTAENPLLLSLTATFAHCRPF